jgi:hydroxymethylpyrimidine/phosphomethylpyrimidine kinase
MKMIENCAALTIAGSDPGGGAGIQADLKTFSAMGVYGTCVITAVTAQNLDRVTAVEAVSPGVVRKQLTAVLEGFPIKAIKTGMLFSGETIEATAEILSNYRRIPLIVDPVLTATMGGKLLRDDALDVLKDQLFPLAALITPNIPEAKILAEIDRKSAEDVESVESVEYLARKLFDRFGVPILLKGGHRADKAEDVLVDGDGVKRFASEFIEGVNTHGSGCTLASAIAAAVARGESLREAIDTAKTYITEALKNALHLSPELRILNHFPHCGEPISPE